MNCVETFKYELQAILVHITTVHVMTFRLVCVHSNAVRMILENEAELIIPHQKRGRGRHNNNPPALVIEQPKKYRAVYR